MRDHATVALLGAVVLATAQPSTISRPEPVLTALANVFVPGDLSVRAGARLTFGHSDAAPHNVVADETGRRGPLFASRTITAGQSAVVTGVDRLRPGTYTFYCSIHPRMRGSLTVTAGTGAAVRPT